MLVIITAIGSAIFSFVSMGSVVFQFIINANFGVGAFVMLVGVLAFMFPMKLSRSKLLDHSTFGTEYVEKKEERQLFAHRVLFTGVCQIFVVGVVEYIMWLL